MAAVMSRCMPMESIQDVSLASLRADKQQELLQRLHDPGCRASVRASIKNSAIGRSQAPETSARPKLRRSGSAPQLTSSPRQGLAAAGKAPAHHQGASTPGGGKLSRGSSTPNLHQTASPQDSKHPPWRFYRSGPHTASSATAKRRASSCTSSRSDRSSGGAAEALRSLVLQKPPAPARSERASEPSAGGRAAAAAALRSALAAPPSTTPSCSSSSSSRLLQQSVDAPKLGMDGTSGSNLMLSTNLGDEQKQLLEEYSNLLQGVRDVLQRSPIVGPIDQGGAAAVQADMALQRSKCERLSKLRHELSLLEEQEKALCVENQRLRAALLPDGIDDASRRTND
mmetsp:Transcript_24325/g.44653  ORF Transcript_24325/g.44653 Transcript_24325/m.44653 type:complete len:341 (-) Transcript_24325:54-1076(-)